MTKDSILAASIQKELDRGLKNPQGLSIFRLVWSEDLFEKRIGTYRTFEGDVFIREEKKLDTVKKYNWLLDRWIFEQWFPPEIAYNSEIPESASGSYESMYIFEDKKGNPLPLNLMAVQYLVHKCLKPKTSEAFKKSYSKALKEQREALAFKSDMDMLNDDGPLVSQFHDKSAILMPGVDF